MRAIFDYPYSIYLISGLACLLIMLIIDFHLGVEAEHLNAWEILNKLIGNDIGIEDSLAIRIFGLYGSVIITLLINSILGIILTHLIKGIIQFIHFLF